MSAHRATRFLCTAASRARKVVVGVDGSDGSNLALRLALKEVPTNGTLLMLHVPNPLCFDASQAGPELTERILKIREEKAASVRDAANNLIGPQPDINVEWVVGDPGIGARQEFVNACKDEDISLLVLGAEGHNSHSHLWAGSLVDYLVHHAPCSVMVARSRP